MPDQTLPVTRLASELVPGDRIAGGFLPLGDPGLVLFATSCRLPSNRDDWALIVTRFDDGYVEASHFLADADIPLDRTTADPTGLGYTRADSDDDDPTPVSPARVPLHTGSVVDGGQLVTDVELGPDPNHACAAHDDAHLGQPCPDRTPLPAPTDERDCRYLALVNSLALLDDGDTVPGEPCPDPAFYATTFARGSEIYTRTCRAHDWSLRTVPGYVSSVALP